MSDEYEIIWESGYVDRLRASQISWPNNWARAMGQDVPNVVDFHDTIDGKWTLVLHAHMNDIRTVRNLTRAGEIIE